MIKTQSKSLAYIRIYTRDWRETVTLFGLHVVYLEEDFAAGLSVVFLFLAESPAPVVVARCQSRS